MPLQVEPSGIERDVNAAVDSFADALCHFAGEMPDLEVLRGWLDERAVVAEAGASGDTAEAWLARVAARAAARRAEGLGHFVEVRKREVLPLGQRLLCVVLEVRASETTDGVALRTATTSVEITMQRVRRRLRMTRLTVGRSTVAV